MGYGDQEEVAGESERTVCLLEWFRITIFDVYHERE